MKLSPSIFERAAELIASDDHGFACCAIDEAEGWFDEHEWSGPHGIFFDGIFRPATASPCTAWWCSDFAAELEYEERREARILALLLCAEMVRDQNRRKKKP